jgi:glycosyltransferase involved in cell wall biosynthesis
LGAKALVLSSRYEGFGMVLGEAMALRVPVISTDCPTGPRDLLDDGRAGLLVPVGDALAMSAAIRTILTDAHLRERLIEHAFDRIKRYHPVEAAERLMALVG